MKNEVNILFGLALLFLSAGIGGTFVALSRLSDAEKWVAHTHAVQANLGRLNAIVSRAGRMRTQYVNSGTAADLHEFQVVVFAVPQVLATLRDLTSDNPKQQASLVELGKEIDQRLALFRESVYLKQDNKSTLENQSRISQGTLAIAADMDDVLDKMSAEEQELLEQRIDRQRYLEQWVFGLLALTFVSAALFFVITHRLLSSELESCRNAHRVGNPIMKGTVEAQS